MSEIAYDVPLTVGHQLRLAAIKGFARAGANSEWFIVEVDEGATRHVYRGRTADEAIAAAEGSVGGRQ